MPNRIDPMHSKFYFVWDGAEKPTRPQFAPVCGAYLYEQMVLEGIFPSYHLLLAHDIVDKAYHYERLFRPENFPYGRTIILDNSVVELGAAVDVHMVREAAEIVKANVIVLPDVYRDGAATTESCLQALPRWRNVFNDALGEDAYTFMMVPQGRTLEEYAACAEQFSAASSEDFTDIGYWGIARNMVEHIGSRMQPTLLCQNLAPDRKIHLLGFSDNMIDDYLVTRDFNETVTGIDSAVPVRLGLEGTPFTLTTDAGKRPDNYLDLKDLTTMAKTNIQYAQKLFGGTN